jgi:hypothetical protein
MFFDAWFTRHQELVNKSSAFLVKATYFANFADVLRQYPRLDGFVQIMEMKGQYTHLCQVWKVSGGGFPLIICVIHTPSPDQMETLPDPYRANQSISG